MCFVTTLTHFSSIAPSHAGSKISLFGCCFWYLLRERSRGRHFRGFCRFWGPCGDPWGDHFETCSLFVGGSVLVRILKRKVKRFWCELGTNSGRGGSLLDLQDLARTCKWISTRPATPASGGAADIPLPQRYSLLFVAIRCYSSLFVAICRYSLLFVAIIILTAIRRYSLLFVVSTR